jgi:phytanoyl-CoA hydroxylase
MLKQEGPVSVSRIFSVFVLLANLSLGMEPEFSLKRFDLPSDNQLTGEMKEYYTTHGFLIFNDVVGPSQREALIAKTKELVPALIDHFSICTAFVPDQKTELFKMSAHSCKIFLEEGPEYVSRETGDYIEITLNHVNKIGHTLHEEYSEFRETVFNHRILGILDSLEIKKPLVPQSMVIVKAPRIGSAVLPHQDATFLLTKPLCLTGFWTPMEDATIENACLWAIPGSHKQPLYRRYVYDTMKNETRFVDLLEEKPNWSADQFVPLEMPAGSLIVFDGKLVHKSEANISDITRLAFTWHVIDGTTFWLSDNWIQRWDFDRSFLSMQEKK